MTTRLALVLAMAAAGTASAGPLGVKVEARVTQSALHRGESAIAEVLVTNTTSTTQAFRIMSCSWDDSWRSDDRGFTTAGLVACAKNTETVLELAPDETDLRKLAVVVANDAAYGSHVVRLGWSPIGAKATEWSAPITFTVVEVSSDVAVTAKRIADRRYTFAIANATKHPLQIGGLFTVQGDAGGAWADLSAMDASCNALPAPPTCMTLEPGKPFETREWEGMSCARCVCAANVILPPGNYRLVVHSCDGKRDYVGGAITLLR